MRLTAWGLGLGLLFAAQAGCGGSGDGAGGSGGAGAGHAGGGGSASGGSPANVCEPGSTRSCYDGPAGTEAKGICKDGKQTCRADGSGFGACEGEVLPQPENCTTKADEDCDGKAPACTGDVQWAEALTGPDYDAATALCSDASDNLYLVGEFGASLTLPNGMTLTEGQGATNTVVAKFDGAGKLLWAKVFASGPGELNVGYACSALPDGSGVVVGGDFSGSIDFGDDPIVNDGQDEAYVVALDASGKLIWHRIFAGDYAVTTGLAAGADGAVAVGGGFHGAMTIDGGTTFTTGTTLHDDGFVIKLDPKGKPVWARQLRGLDGGDRRINGVAIGPDGVVAVAGTAYGPADFGSGVASTTAGADQDAVVGIFSAKGDQLALKQFGDASAQSALSVAFDPAANLVVAGRFAGTLDVGDGAPLVTDGSSTDAFALKLDRKGKVLARRAFGSPASNEYGSAVVDAAGNVVIQGQYGPSPIMIGATTLAGGAARTAYVAKLDNDLNPLWAESFVADAAWSAAAAVDTKASVFVAGSFSSAQIDFDASHSAMGVAGYDMFLVRLAQ